MCIRDRVEAVSYGKEKPAVQGTDEAAMAKNRRAEILYRCCLLYTSDAADERSSVDLGGRRIINKKHRHSVIDGAMSYTQTTHSSAEHIQSQPHA